MFSGLGAVIYIFEKPRAIAAATLKPTAADFPFKY